MLEIKVTMETQYGLERAVEELRWLLSWRGKFAGYHIDAKTPGRVTLLARISNTWQNDDKLGYLQTWIAAKAHSGFKVLAVEPFNLSEKIARDGNLIMLKEPA